MVKKRHKKDKKLHNFNEKLHNSNELDLTWQEEVDLQPEDEAEGGSQIYYFAAEGGNIHSREFLTEELIPDEKEVGDSFKGKSSGKLQKLKSAAVDIISLRAPNGPSQQVTLPTPKAGEPPLDIRISSEVVPDLSTQGESQWRSGVDAADKQVIIHLHDGSPTNEPVSVAHGRDARAPLTLYFTRAELDAYVAYRSEGMAKKSKDWISRSSEALWLSTKGEISHQTATGLRTFVLDKYQSRDSHSKVLSFTVGFLNYSWLKLRSNRATSPSGYFLKCRRLSKSKKRLRRGLSLVKILRQCFNVSPLRKKKGPILRRYAIPALLHSSHLTRDYDRARYSA